MGHNLKHTRTYLSSAWLLLVHQVLIVTYLLVHHDCYLLNLNPNHMAKWNFFDIVNSIILNIYIYIYIYIYMYIQIKRKTSRKIYIWKQNIKSLSNEALHSSSESFGPPTFWISPKLLYKVYHGGFVREFCVSMLKEIIAHWNTELWHKSATILCS